MKPIAVFAGALMSTTLAGTALAQVIVDTSSNVGIKTTTPQGVLDVSGIADGGQVFFRSTGRPLLNIKGDANSYKTLRLSDGADGSYRWDLNVVPNNDANAANALQFFSNYVGASVVAFQQDGRVGIGTTTPTAGYLLTVNGSALASTWATTSDGRFKDNIETLKPGALATVQKLRPVSFTWNEPKDDGMRGQQTGFIAQDVQKVLPAVVFTAKDKDGTLAIKYTELIPVLTAAIQEQQAEIEALRAQVAVLKSSR